MLKGRIAVLLFVACLMTISPAGASNWTRFRGPNGTGIADDKDIPVAWDFSKHLLWKVALPGLGNSSPVIWNDRLFVQTSSKDGSERSLLCINVKNGATVWQAKTAAAKATIHAKNSYASSSPAVDRERVYAVFWDGDHLLIKAYTHSGDKVWSKDLGKYASQHGAGASPVVFEDKVIYFNDQDDKAELLCFNAKTGTIVWHVDRPAFRACYSSPVFRDLPNGQKELIVASTKGITGYDPHKGTQHWNWEWKFYTKMDLRTTGSPIYAHGMLFACSGDGGGPRHMVAVDLGETPKLAWENRKDFPYVPTPVAVGDHLYFVNDKGFAGCYEAKTGKQMWFTRLMGDCTASPIVIDGKVYAIDEDGEAFVFEANPTKLNVLAKNSLGETDRATPAVADNRLFIRGQQHLFCIGKAK
jgi:outer membrane protein assembly factor BamB